MKKYISSILIPCLLLQLTGCYSFRDITLDELKKYEGADDLKITTEKDEILIKRDSTETYVMIWEISDSSIIVREKTFSENNDAENSIDKENEIKFHQIKNIAIYKSDSTKTEGLILLAVILAASITGILIAIGNQNLISIEF